MALIDDLLAISEVEDARLEGDGSITVALSEPTQPADVGISASMLDGATPRAVSCVRPWKYDPDTYPDPDTDARIGPLMIRILVARRAAVSAPFRTWLTNLVATFP